MILRNVRNALAEKTASARKHPLIRVISCATDRIYALRAMYATPHTRATDYSGYLGYRGAALHAPPRLRQPLCARGFETAWQYYDSVIITSPL